MRGSTHGDRKLSRPAVNEISTPNETASIPSASSGPDASAGPLPSPRRRLLRLYYGLKYRVFRRERRPRDGRRGLIALQIDALAYADLRRALRLGYCPTLERLLRERTFH